MRATAGTQEGYDIGSVLAAGVWRSGAFARYMNEDVIDGDVLPVQALDAIYDDE